MGGSASTFDDEVGKGLKGATTESAAQRATEDQEVLAMNAQAAANQKALNLKITQTGEANAFGTSYGAIDSGAGRSGRGLSSDITSPLGFESGGTPMQKRLLGL